MKMKIELGHFHISHIFFPLKYHFGGKSHRYFFFLKSIKVKKGKKKIKDFTIETTKNGGKKRIQLAKSKEAI